MWLTSSCVPTFGWPRAGEIQSGKLGAICTTAAGSCQNLPRGSAVRAACRWCVWRRLACVSVLLVLAGQSGRVEVRAYPEAAGGTCVHRPVSCAAVDRTGASQQAAPGPRCWYKGSLPVHVVCTGRTLLSGGGNNLVRVVWTDSPPGMRQFAAAAISVHGLHRCRCALLVGKLCSVRSWRMMPVSLAALAFLCACVPFKALHTHPSSPVLRLASASPQAQSPAVLSQCAYAWGLAAVVEVDIHPHRWPYLVLASPPLIAATCCSVSLLQAATHAACMIDSTSRPVCYGRDGSRMVFRVVSRWSWQG